MHILFIAVDNSNRNAGYIVCINRAIAFFIATINGFNKKRSAETIAVRVFAAFLFTYRLPFGKRSCIAYKCCSVNHDRV
jgi:hypothetical protein